MNKSNNVDLGSIKIHKKVLADIIYGAVNNLEGVSLAPLNLSSSLGEILGMTKYPGIAITVNKNNQVTIDVQVSVQDGSHIPDIARQTQDAIRSAMDRTVDIDLKDVNVKIQGIERP